MAEFLRRCILPALAWLALAGPGPDDLLFGAAATAGAAFLGLRLAPDGARRVRPLAIAALVPRFLRRSLMGGIDVARRALDPAMPLNPGWCVLATRVPAGAPRVAIAGEFSLMPGTLVAGARGDLLLVHCLDAAAPVPEEVAAEERRLLAALGADGAGDGTGRGPNVEAT